MGWGFFEDIGDGLKSAGETIWGGAKTVWDGTVGGVVNKGFDFITHTEDKALDFIEKSPPMKFANHMEESAAKVMGAVGDTAVGVGKTAVNFVDHTEKGISKLTDGVGDAIGGLGKGLGSIGDYLPWILVGGVALVGLSVVSGVKRSFDGDSPGGKRGRYY